MTLDFINKIMHFRLFAAVTLPLQLTFSILHHGITRALRYTHIVRCLTWACAGLGVLCRVQAQESHNLKESREVRTLQQTKVQAADKSLRLNIQNVDITQFPNVGLIVEAIGQDSAALSRLDPRKITVLENGKLRKLLSIRRISVERRIPIDFVFAIDVTGTMQEYIDAVRMNVEQFTRNLVERGIDYRIGLVLFSDSVEVIRQPTADVREFINWMSDVYAKGGLDEKENALEALAASMRMKYRPSANRITLLVTDAPYHQYGDKSGFGVTSFTTRTIIDSLNKYNTRVIPIAPKRVRDYNVIAESTRGSVFDIRTPFSKILDIYAQGLSNLYAITYLSEEPAIPDSVNVALLNEQKQELVRKTIPILEVGRKLIIEDLLFDYNRSLLVGKSQPQLEKIAEFMHNRKNVVIRVEGHTDATGSAEANLRLSMSRAEAVKSFLVKKNIAPYRIQTIGFGKTRPIASNDTEFGRRLNRRTEVVIIEK
jgi:outer membrane protein OmpA-like peptidoglycan-associated protein/Mg-chelatase subunit ChlD